MQQLDTRLLEPEGKYHATLTEHEVWEKVGCSNRQEYKEYINQQLWREYTPDIRNDCYIGTHESNLSKFRRTGNDERGDTY